MYNRNYNCTTPHYIQQLWWGDHCKHCNHSKKHNSNSLSVHQWNRCAIRDSQQPTSPIGFVFLKLPSSPCAVLLVIVYVPIPCYFMFCGCVPDCLTLKLKQDNTGSTLAWESASDKDSTESMWPNQRRKKQQEKNGNPIRLCKNCSNEMDLIKWCH